MMVRGGMCVGSNFVSAHGHRPRYEHSSSAHLPRPILHPTHPILPRLLRHPSVAHRPSHPCQAAPYPKSSWSLGEVSSPPATPSRAWPQESADVNVGQEMCGQRSSLRSSSSTEDQVGDLPFLLPLDLLQGWLLRRGGILLASQVASYPPVASLQYPGCSSGQSPSGVGQRRPLQQVAWATTSGSSRISSSRARHNASGESARGWQSKAKRC